MLPGTITPAAGRRRRPPPGSRSYRSGPSTPDPGLRLTRLRRCSKYHRNASSSGHAAGSAHIPPSRPTSPTTQSAACMVRWRWLSRWKSSSTRWRRGLSEPDVEHEAAKPLDLVEQAIGEPSELGIPRHVGQRVEACPLLLPPAGCSPERSIIGSNQKYVKSHKGASGSFPSQSCCRLSVRMRSRGKPVDSDSGIFFILPNPVTKCVN